MAKLPFDYARLVAAIPQAGDSNDAYYIYSSKAQRQESEDTYVLPEDTNVDNFVALLPGMVIVLDKKPSITPGTVNITDKWLAWMQHWDASCTLSMTAILFSSFGGLVPPLLTILSFEFRITKPWDVTFSSRSEVLLSAFGPQSQIFPPGLPEDGTPLYLGLDTDATSADLNSTVGDLFKFAELGRLAGQLPSGVAELKTVLKRENASGKRNAMWFKPETYLNTTMRLNFEFKDFSKLEDALTTSKILEGLKFKEASIICKKSLALASTNNGPQAIPAGEVYVQVGCVVTPKGSSKSVELRARLEFFDSGFAFTLQVKATTRSKEPLQVILEWLLGLLPSDSGLDSVETILEKDGIFSDYIYLRRFSISVDTSGDKFKLSSLKVDIEVCGKFGQGSDNSKRPTFLVTYSWSDDIGGLGFLNGDFWNWFDASPERLLSSKYEAIDDLQPLAENPAASIDLVTLISGETIEDVPANVPTLLTSAGIFLSKDTFAVTATVQSKSYSTEESTVPQIDLGQIKLYASFQWGKQKDFSFVSHITTMVAPGPNSSHQEPAVLMGSLSYSSSAKTWELKADLHGLYASTLYEFFDPDSTDHVMPLIDSLAIANMSLDYKYTGQIQGEQKGRSVGTYFSFDGLLLVAALQLEVKFEFETQQEILSSVVGGDDDLELPSFLANTIVSGKDGGGITVDVRKAPTKEGMFQFISTIAMGDVELTFAQIHMSKWEAKIPSKRFIKVALTTLPKVDIPLVGELTQPFDEIYVMWIQDGTGTNKTMPGLTRKEIDCLNLSLDGHTLVPKDKFKTKKDTDVLLSAGSHFAVIMIDQNKGRTCVLDYDFKKSASPRNKGEERQVDEKSRGAGGKKDSDGDSASAPFKKKAGPLSISNIGLKYADSELHIRFTATFELGPLEFSLIGFSLNLELKGLKSISLLPPSLEGLAVAFERPPLTLAGIFRHGTDPSLEYYAGGLIIGWTPYQIQAAGFYGWASAGNGPETTFISVFVFARLDGPLLTLEFAEISGVTGGFGYNSEVRLPTPDQIVNFPFIKTTALQGATDSALSVLERLTSPEADGWFAPLNNTYWAAAGMKIDAFEMIALDAVAVVQFGQSIKLGLFAVALVDIPTGQLKQKFAHVELGIAIVIDLDYGILKTEAQLSPNSYILHPDCHLTGGFALYYWFDAPHADRALIGNFVFTLGGYHQAFEVPKGYPNPPRLGISWSVGSHISITGEAYFAITPKVCMGGGRLHAAFSAGPIGAWFDAFANFLINYQPFFFQASAAICVGVGLDIDFLFIHCHKSIEVGATLYLWGPPLAGRVHIDVKVYKFDIDFGDSSSGDHTLSLLEFYHLVLQTDSQQDSGGTTTAKIQSEKSRVIEVEEDEEREVTQGEKPREAEGSGQPPKDEGHTFLATAGLMNDTEKPEREQNQTWTVRGGAFSLVVGCKMAISKAEQTGVADGNYVAYTANDIYSKPMRLTQPLDSTMELSITQEGSNIVQSWKMEAALKSVPTGLWAKYDTRSDPVRSGNNIDSLLSKAQGGITLMMGVSLTAPPPQMSDDRLQIFDILDADLQSLISEKPFPEPPPPHPYWDPVAPLPGAQQWADVRSTWEKPDWDTNEVSGSGQKQAEPGVQTQFVTGWAESFGWDVALAQLAKIPKKLDDLFDELYVAAPLLTA
ncbi:hypothetical protein EKO27_g5282 [Xylaria grammica]|uniref:DUF6603 domain-containing protein n=1 Tax=Xylaria grammica TaxID=363999 RepID=A0A439D5Y7_9PEZI|nr:hypothetical protein EKO27_g5282 [Xylaria grammica]